MHVLITLPKFEFERKGTPYPTERDCAHMMIECEEYQSWKMVHGFVSRRGKLKRYAWLQKGAQIFDVKAKKLTDRKSFMSRNKPIGINVYSYEEVRRNMKRFRRYGRWEM